MKLWELHAKHDSEVCKVLQDIGCMDKRLKIRKWSPEAFPKLGASGHTSLDFDKCECKKAMAENLGR